MKLFTLLILLLVLFLSSCEKHYHIYEDKPDQIHEVQPEDPVFCKTDTFDLITENEWIGTLIVAQNDVDVHFTYKLENGWQMSKSNLFAGHCDSIPATSMNDPDVNRFPYRNCYTSPVAHEEYIVALSSLESCFCFAAHAEIVDCNGYPINAWADGIPFNGSSCSCLAYFSEFCTVSCDPSCGCPTTGANSPSPTTCEITVGDYRTQTQGGWGSSPSGDNPGTYLHYNFSSAFPSGMQVGCDYTISLTSAQAVTDFVPQGGTPVALQQNYTDPTEEISVLAGQVVALTLSVVFDEYDSQFGASDLLLSSLVIAEGPMEGLSVSEVLTEGNAVMGGCISDYSLTEINETISKINQNFVDGSMDGGYLVCNE